MSKKSCPILLGSKFDTCPIDCVRNKVLKPPKSRNQNFTISYFLKAFFCTPHIGHSVKEWSRNQGWGSGFGQKPDPGLCTSNGGRLFKVSWMNIFDNFKAFFLFLYFGVRRPLYSPKAPDPGWIFPDPVGFLNLGHLWYVWHQKYEK